MDIGLPVEIIEVEIEETPDSVPDFEPDEASPDKELEPVGA